MSASITKSPLPRRFQSAQRSGEYLTRRKSSRRTSNKSRSTRLEWRLECNEVNRKLPLIFVLFAGNGARPSRLDGGGDRRRRDEGAARIESAKISVDVSD